MTTPAWHQDPAELDRTVEGQLDPAALAARRAEAAADPALAARLEERRRFLAALSAEGTRYRSTLQETIPAELDERVRAALAPGDAKGAPLPLLRWAVAAAAVLLMGVGMSFFISGDGSDAVAMPPAVIEAAQAARSDDPGPRGCEDEGELSPLRFPPVKDGSLRIWACAERNGGTVAKLYRPEELPSVGYAAMPAPGVAPGPNVGRTDLGDTVVFDITYGRRSHYIAVRTAWLDRQRSLTPGRESCRACHHLSRVGQKNPHKIIQRSWKLGAP